LNCGWQPIAQGECPLGRHRCAREPPADIPQTLVLPSGRTILRGPGIRANDVRPSSFGDVEIGQTSKVHRHHRPCHPRWWVRAKQDPVDLSELDGAVRTNNCPHVERVPSIAFSPVKSSLKPTVPVERPPVDTRHIRTPESIRRSNTHLRTGTARKWKCLAEFAYRTAVGAVQ
jgi:hypothetical protein